MIGQCGLMLQTWKNREILEVGYLFDKTVWHRGYATEAARACTDYAFSALEAVYSVIRAGHAASQAVARRNGMRAIDRCTKNFRNVDMDFLRFSLQREKAKAEAASKQ